MTTLSTHILDISIGQPAADVVVQLYRDGQAVATAVTNDNGRIADFHLALIPAQYRLVADTGAWFARQGRATLFPCAQIDFVIVDTADEHFHLPFLIAPGGWSTYRGS